MVWHAEKTTENKKWLDTAAQMRRHSEHYQRRHSKLALAVAVDADMTSMAHVRLLQHCCALHLLVWQTL